MAGKWSGVDTKRKQMASSCTVRAAVRQFPADEKNNAELLLHYFIYVPTKHP